MFAKNINFDIKKKKKWEKKKKKSIESHIGSLDKTITRKIKNIIENLSKFHKLTYIH